MISFFVGGLLGWAASMLTGTDERTGVILNVIVGIVGAVLGAWLLSGLIGFSPFDQIEFSLISLLVSLQTAMVLLAAVQLRRDITVSLRRTAP